jgi:hypothetical protein
MMLNYLIVLQAKLFACTIKLFPDVDGLLSMYNNFSRVNSSCSLSTLMCSDVKLNCLGLLSHLFANGLICLQK